VNTIELVRHRLGKVQPNEVNRPYSDWIEGPTIRPIGSSPAKITAHEALRLWRTRLKTARAEHHGMTHLIERLEKLTPQKQVEQFSFDGKDSAATYVFTRTGAEFLGSIVVKRSRN
jgi:hypothetical protein